MKPTTNKKEQNRTNHQRLWPFCLALYARPQVPTDCIMLQDRLAVDVNLLLYACWAACFIDKPLTPEDFRHLISLTTDWQTGVVVPIRQARRAAKRRSESHEADADAKILAQLKETELAVEQVEIDMLAAHAPAPSVISGKAAARNERARANLNTYLKSLSLTPDADARSALARIAAAAGELAASPDLS